MIDYELWWRGCREVKDHDLWFEKQEYDKEKLLKKCEKIERKHYYSIDIDFWKLILLICVLAEMASSLTLITLIFRCYIIV